MSLSASNSKRIIPSETPGEIRVEISPDDELLHFKWTTRRGQDLEGEEFDLIVFPGDASFVPYQNPTGAPNDGRICVLKFQSSDQRHFFWLQSKAASGEAGKYSQKDLLIVRKIDRLIQTGGDLDGITDEELLGDDSQMELDDDAAPSAGESSRRGGADGGRASEQVPQQQQPIGSASAGEKSQSDLLASLIRGISVPGQAAGSTRPQGFLTLPSLLQPNVTTAVLESKAVRQKLLANLPPVLTADVKTEYEEKELLRRVLHSPQFSQATATLTVALREGGLRGVADSLGVKLDLANAGTQGGVEIFVGSVKKQAEEEGDDGDGDTAMS
ncbi:hypothetical protein DRE_01528 [Drechslerella stenobrocha 248]|uniref:Uncharacterized protein n=1 Tax=Drechslerella stenobrocha 248 TaxID=1043628 RepID=W7HID6_9PEZI|nr:hypothetical protein DRE_01528 [Drechslerella stenobrocha 248]